VSLLRELSRTDFHAAFGWDDLRPPLQPPASRPQPHPRVQHRRAGSGGHDNSDLPRYSPDDGDGSTPLPPPVTSTLPRSSPAPVPADDHRTRAGGAE
ncbi:unnamed protein product, partial [Ectocarpus sp. 12 AP-2014]